MQTAVIAGGSGMIGTHLAEALIAKGYRVIILSRKKNIRSNQPERKEYAFWDVKNGMIDRSCIEQADYIVNLAGAHVMDRRWTRSYKKEILESRTGASKLIADSLLKIPNRVKSVINMSAIGWYGEDRMPGYRFTESDPADPGFLGSTCKAWEESIPDQIGSTKVCRMRTGIVIAPDGGFIEELKLPVSMGIAPIISKGRQMISWIHIRDLCRMFIYAMENGLEGNYNAVAPEPVSNKEITLSYARHAKGKFVIPIHVPGILLKLALGERAIEILKSTFVSCRKISEAGFQFEFSHHDAAMREITEK